jgi:hypothetical protein
MIQPEQVEYMGRHPLACQFGFEMTEEQKRERAEARRRALEEIGEWQKTMPWLRKT